MITKSDPRCFCLVCKGRDMICTLIGRENHELALQHFKELGLDATQHRAIGV